MSVHEPIAAVSRSRSGTEPNASCTHRLYPRAPASHTSKGQTPLEMLCARSLARRSPWYTISAAMPSRSICARRTSTSLTPRDPPVAWSSRISGRVMVMTLSGHVDFV